jgi:uncharacterized membrane protein YhaH (DUF805 family)
MDWKRLFLSPEGRIGRGEFWIGFLVILGVSVVLGFIPILGQLVSLLLLWPTICIYSKRLHDFGKSGWLQLVPIVSAIVFTIAAVVTGGGAVLMGGASGDANAGGAAALAGMGMAMLFIALIFLVWLAFLLWVGLSKSDAGPNRFGPPPAPLAPPPPQTAA